MTDAQLRELGFANGLIDEIRKIQAESAEQKSDEKWWTYNTYLRYIDKKINFITYYLTN